ncbi:F-box domain-containing protein [Mycena sanguinolenta]|uniref:F-box domain-containing protein n=1 Tax=Mycena sanguinolenta TaxID=230812 RepID=A0A8H7CXK6_9AGAR|nr:F-box domain-containing protein [Mycena sanguinolenta]
MDPTNFLNALPTTQTSESRAQAKLLIKAAEANIACIESQMKDLERLRDQERGIITRLWMAIAPVHQLPPELLAEIFLIVHEDVYPFSRKGRVQKVQALSQVCAFWRSVAHTTPRLWTESLSVKVDETPTADYVSFVKEWLERSALIQIPVQLKIPGKNVEMGPLMDAVATTAHRWKRAIFDIPSLSIFCSIPPDSLKSLKRLSLRSADAKHHKDTQPFVTAGRLRRVSLTTHRTSGLLMPWSQLTHMNVIDTSPQECLDALVQCTAIVSAKFETMAWQDFPDMSQRPITTLARLKKLCVEFCTPGGFIVPFFVCLALPALATLTLELDIDHTWSSAEFTQFQLRSPNIEDLTIERSPMESDDLLAVLQHAPLLVSLHMECCMYCFDNSFLDGLQYSPAQAVHLAPKLEFLSWTYAGVGFDEDALDAMIRSRWWTDEQLLAFPSPPRVARLASVDILCDDDADNVSLEFMNKMEEYRSQGLEISVS